MFYGKNADLRADQAGYNTPFAGVLQLLAVPSWHCHHQCPAAFSLDTCTSLTNTAETHPTWGAITALVHPPSYLSFWSRFGAISGGKVEIWMCLPRWGACVCLPTHTYARGWMHSAEGCAFVYLQQATASWSHRDFSSLAPLRSSHIKLCLAAASSDKSGL